MTGSTKKFVIQQHQRRGQPTHYDLMIQQDQKLATWQLQKIPAAQNPKPTKAKKIFDHDEKFLTYQGPVNKGRGKVTLKDTGTVKIIKCDENILRLNFNGQHLNGNFQLKHLENNNWTLEPF